MLRYIFRYRWLTFSFIFLLVLAALFCVWTLHDLGSFKKRLSITDDINLQDDMSQKAQNKVRGDVQQTKSFNLMENQSESVEDTSVPTEETTPTTDTVDNNVSIDLASDTLTSPFGFGPYPDVPADYPVHELLWDNATPEHELLVRVRIKLWKQGTQTTGAIYETDILPVLKHWGFLGFISGSFFDSKHLLLFHRSLPLLLNFCEVLLELRSRFLSRYALPRHLSS